MASADQIRARLPTLWRPEPGDPGLLAGYLQAVGTVLDALNAEAAQIMQAHWAGYADAALFSPYFRRRRALEERLPIPADDPELETFPHVADLARIGALLPLLPWRDPPSQRESVEAYRRRIAKIVALYRQGLGTVAALGRSVDARLPQPARPFTIEEFAPLTISTSSAVGRGAPAELVGPLMRWPVANDGIDPAAPTLYIEGVEPQPDLVDATVRPAVELFSAGGAPVRLAIGYDGTLAPGRALRLRPGHASWIGRADGIGRAEARPSPTGTADPSAPGPWSDAPGAPSGPVVGFAVAPDRALWAALGDGTLWRLDAAGWAEAVTGLAEPLAVAADGTDLLVGTADGLLRLPLYPEDGVLSALPAEPGGVAVHAVLRGADGSLWTGTEDGLRRDGTPFGLDAGQGTGTAVLAIHQDRAGTIYLGTALGLFQHQPASGHWYWYEGRARSDQVPDWQRFEPERSGAERNFPAADAVFLPPVRCVRRGPDDTLWIGTEAGIARYIARAVGPFGYTTLLEAFPEFGTGPVFAIAADERGAVWFATAQGLFRCDGRSWWQSQGGTLVRLPRTADPDAARPWRFDRAAAVWQHTDPALAGAEWVAFDGTAVAAAEPAVTAIAWTDEAVADLGSLGDAGFIADPEAVPAALRLRFKPDETRILDGGIPAVPRLPPGTSEWRYLMMEDGPVPAPKTLPAWTSEGRLLPPPLRPPVEEGRYGAPEQPLSTFDDAAFAFNPAARVRLSWQPRRPLGVLVRLAREAPDETIEPAIIERVVEGMEQVRPAGVRARLAVDDEIVGGP